MTPREMLELAAEAAGYEVEIDHNGIFHLHDGAGNQSWSVWNPLYDDGDALRLAVKLDLALFPVGGGTGCAPSGWHRGQHVIHNGDPYDAARLAIVRAAAEICKENREKATGETE